MITLGVDPGTALLGYGLVRGDDDPELMTFGVVETTKAETMPERLRLLIVLAAFVGLREGELLELRRSDIDGVTGRINVTRKVDKDVIPATKDACPECGRVISAPKTASGVRTVHVPPPFLPMLQKHLLEHTAPGPAGLLFAGDRTDHMSVRYLMDRYRPAREAIYQHATLDRDKSLADAIGDTYRRWAESKHL